MIKRAKATGSLWHSSRGGTLIMHQTAIGAKKRQSTQTQVLDLDNIQRFGQQSTECRTSTHRLQSPGLIYSSRPCPSESQLSMASTSSVVKGHQANRRITVGQPAASREKTSQAPSRNSLVAPYKQVGIGGSSNRTGKLEVR